MPDLTEKLLPLITQQPQENFGLAGEYTFPAYAGQSLLNIPASLCKLFDLPALGAPPLIPQILDSLQTGYRRIILILMDALALHRLRRWMVDGTAPVWQELADQGILAPVTSITPSTTSAALTSLWTGQPAARHGVTGYEMWLKEYGVIANTILHTPNSFKNDVGSLERAGFNPETFLSLPTLAGHLGKQGVTTYVFQHQSIAHSGLSQMLLHQAQIQGFRTPADLWVNLRQLIEREPEKKLYSYVYWGEVDHFGHIYGPDDERTAAEFSQFSQAMQRLLLEKLSPALRRDTLLVLTADHGQITTPADPDFELRNHPDLAARLHMTPTGENRLAYFYPKPGQYDKVREYIDRTWPGKFTTLDSVEAVNRGLFGPGRQHPSLSDRLGDIIAVANGDAYLWWSEKENILVGRHGGLHAEEMLVPFLAAGL